MVALNQHVRPLLTSSYTLLLLCGVTAGWWVVLVLFVYGGARTIRGLWSGGRHSPWYWWGRLGVRVESRKAHSTSQDSWITLSVVSLERRLEGCSHLRIRIGIYDIPIGESCCPCRGLGSGVILIQDRQYRGGRRGSRCLFLKVQHFI